MGIVIKNRPLCALVIVNSHNEKILALCLLIAIAFVDLVSTVMDETIRQYIGT